MPVYSTKLRIPMPAETDGPPDIPQAWLNAAAVLDTLAPIGEGPLSSRPVSTSGTPGINGRQYITTDQPGGNRLDVDYGTGWFTSGPALVDQAASVGSARTLGTGALQAAAGNDSRITGAEQTANKDVANGYAGLDAGGLLKVPEIPNISATYQLVGQKGVASGYMGLDASSRGAQFPRLHASTHQVGGTDPIPSLTSLINQGANYNAQVGDHVVCTAAAGTQTVYLPAGATGDSRIGITALTTVPIFVSAIGGERLTAYGGTGVTEIPVPPGSTVIFQRYGALNTWYLIDNPYGNTDRLQNGVINSGDFAPSFISCTAAGVIGFQLASGTAWIKNGSGLLVRYANAASGPVTIAPPSLPANGQTQTYNLRMDSTGALTLVTTGAAVAGNTGVSGAAFIPGNGYISIMNVSIYNNAGTYQLSANIAATQGTNWIDRRPWARGAAYRYNRGSAGNYTIGTPVATLIDANNMSSRLECTGVPLSVRLENATFQHPNGAELDVYLNVDGAQSGRIIHTMPVGYSSPRVSFEFTPSAGSHLIQILWGTTSGVATLYGQAGGPSVSMVVEEIVRQNANNGIA